MTVASGDQSEIIVEEITDNVLREASKLVERLVRASCNASLRDAVVEQLEAIGLFLNELAFRVNLGSGSAHQEHWFELTDFTVPFLRLYYAVLSLEGGYVDAILLPKGSAADRSHRPRSVAVLDVRQYSAEAAEVLIRTGRKDAFSFVASELRRLGFERSQGRKPGPITDQTVRGWYRLAKRQGLIALWQDEISDVSDPEAQAKHILHNLHRLHGVYEPFELSPGS
jgi:hypothetical protein